MYEVDSLKKMKIITQWRREGKREKKKKITLECLYTPRWLIKCKVTPSSIN